MDGRGRILERASPFFSSPFAMNEENESTLTKFIELISFLNRLLLWSEKYHYVTHSAQRTDLTWFCGFTPPSSIELWSFHFKNWRNSCNSLLIKNKRKKTEIFFVRCWNLLLCYQIPLQKETPVPEQVCTYCKQKMYLITQIHAPLEWLPTRERVLYIFGCNQPKCPQTYAFNTHTHQSLLHNKHESIAKLIELL